MICFHIVGPIVMTKPCFNFSQPLCIYSLKSNELMLLPWIQSNTYLFNNFIPYCFISSKSSLVHFSEHWHFNINGGPIPTPKIMKSLCLRVSLSPENNLQKKRKSASDSPVELHRRHMPNLAGDSNSLNPQKKAQNQRC